MTEEQQHQPDVPEPIDQSPGETCDPTPPDTNAAKLFVIFFLALIPLLGIAIVALVIYSLLVR
jgi:hypothetical protein